MSGRLLPGRQPTDRCRFPSRSRCITQRSENAPSLARSLRRRVLTQRNCHPPVRMGKLIAPVVAAGTMSSVGQPEIQVDDELTLRAWRAEDAPVVVEAFSDPDIQHWHFRRFQTEAEALGCDRGMLGGLADGAIFDLGDCAAIHVRDRWPGDQLHVSRGWLRRSVLTGCSHALDDEASPLAPASRRRSGHTLSNCIESNSSTPSRSTSQLPARRRTAPTCRPGHRASRASASSMWPPAISSANWSPLCDSRPAARQPAARSIRERDDGMHPDRRLSSGQGRTDAYDGSMLTPMISMASSSRRMP